MDVLARHAASLRERDERVRVLTIFGTRPEAIKMAPVVRELERHSDVFSSHVCVTGQHREMLDQMLDLFEIRPDLDLEIMRTGQSLSDVTVSALAGVTPIIRRYRPHWVLTQGDTTTTMAASLAAFYEGALVGHVEAGLRTGDKRAPMPEETNRRLTAVLADLHFAPTESAATNLTREGVHEQAIVVTGNTVIDALHQVSSRPLDLRSTPLASLPDDQHLILVTAHRRENFGGPMEDICRGIQRVAAINPDAHFVWPVHPNPNVAGPVQRMLGPVPNVSLVPPLDYHPLVWLLGRCRFVITDSGGLQEEGAALGRPVLVLRTNTERPAAVHAGTARLIGADSDRIVDTATHLLRDDYAYRSMARPLTAYGDGRAAQRIVGKLREFGRPGQRRSTNGAAKKLSRTP